MSNKKKKKSLYLTWFSNMPNTNTPNIVQFNDACITIYYSLSFNNLSNIILENDVIKFISFYVSNNINSSILFL